MAQTVAQLGQVSDVRLIQKKKEICGLKNPEIRNNPEHF
jgi:hypothetical protein